MASSIVSLVYGFNGTSYVDTSIRAGIAVPAGQPGQMVLGSDGTTTRYLRLTATGDVVVSGPLTDAQLRASAVPVSIASPVAVTGPLTDAELRASAVPVSLASAPLPAGGATSALQTAGNTLLSSIDTKLTNPLPVSGTVTANIGTIAGLATSANQTTEIGHLLNIASFTSVLSEAAIASGPGSGLGSRSLLSAGQYRAVPPTYTDGDQVPLAVTAQGFLRTLVSGTISIEDFPDVQEVSGFVTTPGLTDEQLRAAPLDVNLPAGASTSALQTTGNASLASIDNKLTAPVVSVSDVEAGLSRLINMLASIPIAIDPSSGRVRVVLDPLGGAQTLNTVTTVTTVSSVTSMTTLATLTNQAQIGGIQANTAILDAMASSWANQVRGRIV